MNAILCADKNWGIGKKNDLLFSIPSDMKFFRKTTSGGVVVMGANTLRSFPNGAPLKNRVNIVLSSGMVHSDCIVVRNLDELRKALAEYTDLPVWVIGGGSVYKLLLPYCEKVLATRVNADGGAEVFFPDLDKDKNFYLAAESEEMRENDLNFRFCEYVNKNVRKL